MYLVGASDMDLAQVMSASTVCAIS